MTNTLEEPELLGTDDDLTSPPQTPSESQKIPPPEATRPLKVQWQYAIVLGLVHVVALLGFVGWFFTWSGLLVGIAGHFIFGMLGITIGYHRLLTHRGFTCPVWLERTLAILASAWHCISERTPFLTILHMS